MDLLKPSKDATSTTSEDCIEDILSKVDSPKSTEIPTKKSSKPIFLVLAQLKKSQEKKEFIKWEQLNMENFTEEEKLNQKLNEVNKVIVRPKGCRC